LFFFKVRRLIQFRAPEVIQRVGVTRSRSAFTETGEGETGRLVEKLPWFLPTSREDYLDKVLRPIDAVLCLALPPPFVLLIKSRLSRWNSFALPELELSDLKLTIGWHLKAPRGVPALRRLREEFSVSPWATCDLEGDAEVNLCTGAGFSRLARTLGQAARVAHGHDALDGQAMKDLGKELYILARSVQSHRHSLLTYERQACTTRVRYSVEMLIDCLFLGELLHQDLCQQKLSS